MDLNTIYNYCIPTEIIYGTGSISGLGTELKRLGGNKVFFITDQGINASGILQRAFQSLEENKLPYFLFDRAPTDPDNRTIDALLPVLRENGSDCIVAAGGGSVMCTGKGLAVLATNGGNLKDYFGTDKFRKGPLLCVCVPTTAGSGAEVAKHTTLTDADTKIKTGIGGVRNAARLAILDATLLVTTPKTQAVASGVDAFCHAAEGYLSNKATLLTDTIALGAIEILVKNFWRSILTNDLQAKNDMLLAATMANMVSNNAGLTLVHGLNSVATYVFKTRGLTPVPYGLLLAIFVSPVFEFNLPSCESKLSRLAEAMGISNCGSSVSERVKGIVDRINELLSMFDIPRKLPWKGISPEEIVEDGIKIGWLSLDFTKQGTNPRKYTKEDLISIISKVL